MTRVNCIPPAELRDKHLLAEYRELPRVFKLAHAAYWRGDNASKYPQEYTLGAGHVKFFYTRLKWLSNRFSEIYAEMLRREWKPQYDSAPNIPYMPQSWHQDWTPMDEAMSINRQRIKNRS